MTPGEPTPASPKRKYQAFRDITQGEGPTAKASGYSQPPAVEITLRGNRTTLIVVIAVVAVIAIGAVVWSVALGPRRELDKLAQETCDDLEGTMVIIGAGTVQSAVRRAERLGFSGPELRKSMEGKCPNIVRQIVRIASQ